MANRPSDSKSILVYDHQTTGQILVINLVLGVLAIVAWLMPSFFLIAMGAGTILLAILYLSVERIRPMHAH